MLCETHTKIFLRLTNCQPRRVSVGIGLSIKRIIRTGGKGIKDGLKEHTLEMRLDSSFGANVRQLVIS